MGFEMMISDDVTLLNLGIQTMMRRMVSEKSKSKKSREKVGSSSSIVQNRY